MRRAAVTFGEIMLRLAPPGFERFLRSRQINASFGSAQANAAVALAQPGLPSAYVAALRDKNPMADAVIAELRGCGVDTSLRVRGPGGPN